MTTTEYGAAIVDADGNVTTVDPTPTRRIAADIVRSRAHIDYDGAPIVKVVERTVGAWIPVEV